jgi:hypothetical protein
MQQQRSSMQLMTDHVCCLLCVCAVQPGPLKEVDTRPVPGPNKTLAHGLALPGHTNAQGDFARFARKLLPALLPDLTDPLVGSRMQVVVTDASRCVSPAVVPGRPPRPAVDFATQSSVVAMGLRQRWGKDGEDFCGFVVVCNLCGAPSSFKLAFEAWEIPADISVATHAFDQNYNTSIGEATGTKRVSAMDWVGGYSTSVLRLGCDGWVMMD